MQVIYVKTEYQAIVFDRRWFSTVMTDLSRWVGSECADWDARSGVTPSVRAVTTIASGFVHTGAGSSMGRTQLHWRREPAVAGVSDSI